MVRKSDMKTSSNNKEKRKHPRTLISLPLHIELNENGTIKEMPVGIKIDIEVLFPEKVKCSNFKAEAEIIWKDICYWDDWEGYQYGLKFIEISKEDYSKLKQILSDPTHLEETDLIEKRDHNPKLIVKTG
jgi:hypothetical protein